MTLSAGQVSLGVKPDTKGFGAKLSEGIMAESGVLGKVGEHLGLKLTAGLAAAAIAAAGVSIKMAADMQTVDAKIQGNAQITAKQATAVGDAFLSTAGKSTFSGQEMAKAFAPVAGVIQMITGHALSAADSMKVMAASTTLAEASGVPLANTTADLAGVMQSFGLKVGDAAETSNTLFNTSRLTNIGLDTLSTTVEKLHGRLGIASPSLAQTSGLMVDLATHGISGSRGVMVAQTALVTLLGGSKATSAELKTLGAHVFDSSGKFVGMQSVLAQLTPKLASMSDQQRNAAEAAIFGKAAATAMNTTVLAGAKGLSDATAKVVAHDAAQKAAEASAGTLKGQIETLKSGFNDVMTLLGEKLIPVLIGTATWFKNNAVLVLSVVAAFAAWKVITVTVGAVNAVIGISRGLMLGMQAASYGVEGATYAVGTAQKVGYTIAAIFNGTMWKQVAALVASKAETVALGAMYAGEFLANTAKAIGSTIASTAAWVANGIAQTAVKAVILGGAIAMGVATAAQWLWNVAMDANPIGLIIIAIGALVAAVVWVATKTTFFQDAWKAAVAVVGAIFNWLWTAVIKPVADWIGGAIGAVGNAVTTVFGAIGNIIKGAFNGVVDFVRGIFNTIIGVVNGIIDGINGATKLGAAIGINIGAIPHLPHLADSGTVLPTPGGTIVRVAEGGKAESVVDTGKLNSLMDAAKHGGGGFVVNVVNKSGVALSDLIEMHVENAAGRRKVNLSTGMQKVAY